MARTRIDDLLALALARLDGISAITSSYAEDIRIASGKQERQRLTWDPNMSMALALGRALCPSATLPESLRPSGRRAALVEAVDGPIVRDFSGKDWPGLAAAIGTGIFLHAHASEPFMPDVPSPLTRAAVSLIIWSGCVSAAKTVAWKTAAGLNTREGRSRILLSIAQVCGEDPLYAAGVEVAVLWKRRRRQKIYVGDVPADHPVRALERRPGRPRLACAHRGRSLLDEGADLP